MGAYSTPEITPHQDVSGDARVATGMIVVFGDICLNDRQAQRCYGVGEGQYASFRWQSEGIAQACVVGDQTWQILRRPECRDAAGQRQRAFRRRARRSCTRELGTQVLIGTIERVAGAA